MRGVCFVCVSGLAHSESELCRAPFRHYFTSLVGTGRAWSPGPPCARACVGTGGGNRIHQTRSTSAHILHLGRVTFASLQKPSKLTPQPFAGHTIRRTLKQAQINPTRRLQVLIYGPTELRCDPARPALHATRTRTRRVSCDRLLCVHGDSPSDGRFDARSIKSLTKQSRSYVLRFVSIARRRSVSSLRSSSWHSQNERRSGQSSGGKLARALGSRSKGASLQRRSRQSRARAASAVASSVGSSSSRANSTWRRGGGAAASGLLAGMGSSRAALVTRQRGPARH